MIFKYLWYILRHKWFVFVECCKLGIPLRGLLHDLSKLRPSEFMPYARYFYGNYPKWDDVKRGCPGYSWKYTKEGVAAAFDKAWLLHQKRNPHHWQFWLLCEDDGDTKVLEMPIDIRREMLADWKGAGRAITGTDNTKEWYFNTRRHRQLARHTKKWVEDQIGV